MQLLLADDHTLFRDALVQYIERAEPGATVVLARDLHEVMEIMAGDANIDLILLDFRMPGMNGLQGLEKLRTEYPAVPVALLSGLAEKQDVEGAMALGAIGYFPKTLSGKAMLKGIHQVLKGERYIPLDHNTDDIMASYYSNGIDAGGGASSSVSGSEGRHQSDSAGINGNGNIRLTPREKEVCSYLLRGASNKEIARGLDVQVVTIKLHVRGICRKLDVKNRTQAALKAQKLGIAETS